MCKDGRTGTSLVVQWPRPCFQCRSLASVPGRGTGSQMSQLRVHVLQPKIPHAATETWQGQTDKYFKNEDARTNYWSINTIGFCSTWILCDLKSGINHCCVYVSIWNMIVISSCVYCVYGINRIITYLYAYMYIYTYMNIYIYIYVIDPSINNLRRSLSILEITQGSLILTLHINMLWYYLLPHAALHIIEFSRLTLPNFVLNTLCITNSNTFIKENI